MGESTVRRRLDGATTARKSHQWQQRIPPEEEAELVRWYTAMDRNGKTPNGTQIRQSAEEMLRSKGDYKPLGTNWHRGFLRRNSLHAERLELEKAGEVSEAMGDDNGGRNTMPGPATPEQQHHELNVEAPKSFQDDSNLLNRLFATSSPRERRLIISKIMAVYDGRDRQSADSYRLRRETERLRRKLEKFKEKEEREDMAALLARHEVASSEADTERMDQDHRADMSVGIARTRSRRKVTQRLLR